MHRVSFSPSIPRCYAMSVSSTLFGTACLDVLGSVLQSQDVALCLCPVFFLVTHAWTFLGVSFNPKMSHYVYVQRSCWYHMHGHSCRSDLQSQDATLCLSSAPFGTTCMDILGSVLQSQDVALCLCPVFFLVTHAWTFLGVSFNPKMSHYVYVQCSSSWYHMHGQSLECTSVLSKI